MLFLPCPQENKKKTAENKADKSDKLRNTYASKIQAVGAQTFDYHTSRAIPGNAHKGNFAVIFFLSVVQIYNNKAYKIPHRFIEKCGMNAESAVICSKSHSPWQVCQSPVSLSVHKIPPAADSLSQHNAGHNRVRYGRKAQLFNFCNNKSCGGSSYKPSVYGKSSVAQGKYLF